MARRTAKPARHRGRRATALAGFFAAPDSDPAQGPQIRLGLLWGLATTIAAAAGPVPLAMVFAPLASLAAAQAARSWRRRQRRAAVAVSAGGAALVVTVSVFGAPAVLVVVVLLGGVLVFARLTPTLPSGHASPGLTGLIALVCGLGGASPVLLRSDGFIPVFVLLSFVHVYDASAYVVGTGARSAWEGPAAGVAGIAAVTLAVAALLSPPFRGATPWLFGLIAAALAPLGPMAAGRLIGDRRARVPAFRRLDSLLVVGPLWALAAVVVLD
ncbi:MAG TPA: hypothetical protein VMZ51_07385 [Acidimicrobiales bacterium]|nr:hypothetical protein [Acidimicrobiales bacterium]